MNLIQKAELIEQTELDLANFIQEKHKAGLTYHDLIRILTLELENTLKQFELEV